MRPNNEEEKEEFAFIRPVHNTIYPSEHFFLHKLIVYYMTVTYNKKEGSGHFCKL